MDAHDEFPHCGLHQICRETIKALQAGLNREKQRPRGTAKRAAWSEPDRGEPGRGEPDRRQARILRRRVEAPRLHQGKPVAMHLRQVPSPGAFTRCRRAPKPLIHGRAGGQAWREPRNPVKKAPSGEKAPSGNKGVMCRAPRPPSNRPRRVRDLERRRPGRKPPPQPLEREPAPGADTGSRHGEPRPGVLAHAPPQAQICTMRQVKTGVSEIWKNHGFADCVTKTPHPPPLKARRALAGQRRPPLRQVMPP